MSHKASSGKGEYLFLSLFIAGTFLFSRLPTVFPESAIMINRTALKFLALITESLGFVLAGSLLGGALKNGSLRTGWIKSAGKTPFLQYS